MNRVASSRTPVVRRPPLETRGSGRLQDIRKNATSSSRGEFKTLKAAPPTANSGTVRVLADNRQPMQDALNALWASRNSSDWDGERPAILKDSYSYAMRFIELLPSTTPVASFDSSMKGYVVLHWQVGKDMATVHVRDDGTFVYSAVVGDHGPRGTERLDGSESIPLDLVKKIGQMFR